MTEQACSRCGAAVIRGTCTLCGLSVGAPPQAATTLGPAAFAAFDPALEDTNPDLPIVPGPEVAMTLPAAPTPAPPVGNWDATQAGPPGPGSYRPASVPPHYGAPSYTTPSYGAPSHGAPSYPTSSYGAQPQAAAHYGAQLHGGQPPAAPTYYASQPAGVQTGVRPAGGGRQLALIIAVVAGVLLVAGAIMAVIGLLGPNRWITFAPGPSTTGQGPANPASTVTVTAAPQAPATTRAPSPTQPRTTTQAAQAVTSLPSGSWITVLESLPKNENTLAAAQARAAGLAGSGSKVSVIDSDAIPGLNGGYWALGVTGHGSRDAAAAICGTFGREAGGSCYPREVG